MTDKTNNNGRNGKLIHLAIILFSSVGGAGGGTFIYLNAVAPAQIQAVARPDPFTGTDGQAIRQQLAELRQTINNQQRQIDRLPPRDLTERIRLLEREVELLRDRQ